MNLTDSIWQELEGAYRTQYDVSIPLRKLETVTTKEEIDNIFEELWNELHHQGDVGEASYLALPQLVRIAKEKDLFEVNLLGICAVIEQQRNIGNNPTLPQEFERYYREGLCELRDLIVRKINSSPDETTFRMACSALAAASGRIKFSKAILELSDDDILSDFLERF